jgi:alkylation response protein AidB-like acyl-CoA dehydrogenase
MMNPTAARADFAAWRAELARNTFDADPHLQSLVAFHGRDAEDLRDFGDVVPALDPFVRENNRDEHLPRLRRWDGQGNRIETVDFHPTYHMIGQAAYASGMMSRYREPGREFETLALLYQFAQNGEAGHSCPLACTAGLIKILQADGSERAKGWLERLLDPDYDTHFHGAQFLTEVQGGSDVGANAIVAEDAGDGSFRIRGEKWFCSVVDADLFLLTARPEGARGGTVGLRTFVVPRELPGGGVNHFAIRRLKYKLGTRSMASAELDFQGAVAYPVADFRQTVAQVLNTSRLYNAICSAAMLQRAAREAHVYARHRKAFGRPILAFPTLARIVARLRTEAYAARSVTFLLAQLSDRIATGQASARDEGAYRMLVNLNKFWTSIAATLSIRDAIEVLGGNGAIEEFSVLPRLLRDSIVCEAWEGGHNVLCAQALKDAYKLSLHEPMFALLEELAGDDVPQVATARARFERLLALPPDDASVHIRDVAEELRFAAQAAVLAAEARHEGSDPLLPVVVDHHLTMNAPGYDPLEDPGLSDRVRQLVG